MPLYRYACTCGKQYDEFRKIADRHDSPLCVCGELTKLRIMPTSVQADNTDYVSLAIDKETGKHVHIGSKRQHREFLARNDYVEVGNDFKPPTRIDTGPEAPMVSMDEMKKQGFIEADL